MIGAISENNSMDTSIKTKKISNSHDIKEEIINKLLFELHSTLQNSQLINKCDLEVICKHHNTGYDFGNEHLNRISLYNWIVYTRSLFVLHKLGHKESELKLQEELERAKRRLETIDFYTDNKDYSWCLSGIWSIVAVFDENEREKFLRSEEIPKSHYICKMVQDFCFDYK